MDPQITCVVRRGQEKGRILTPHRFADGQYVASPTKFEADYRRVDSLQELADLCRQGWRVRMSAQDSKTHRGGSLICPESVLINGKPLR